MSGDLERIRDHLQGRPVVEWTYLEDLALSKPDNSLEYRCLEISTTVGGDGNPVLHQKTKRFLFDLGEITNNTSKKNCASDRFSTADLEFVYNSRGDPVF